MLKMSLFTFSLIFTFSGKPQRFVQAALPGDSGSEPQQPGEPLTELFLWPSSG